MAIDPGQPPVASLRARAHCTADADLATPTSTSFESKVTWTAPRTTNSRVRRQPCMPPNPSPVADTLHAYLPARPQLPPRPHRPRPHEVAVEAAVSLPISDSSCACLVLLIDEGSVADGFSDISDDAHGYEAEEEEDDHAPLAKTRNSQLIRSLILRI